MSQLNWYENWDEKKVKLQDRYEELTDDDLTYVVGEENKLIDRIHQRLGTSREETRNILRQI